MTADLTDNKRRHPRMFREASCTITSPCTWELSINSGQSHQQENWRILTVLTFGQQQQLNALFRDWILRFRACHFLLRQVNAVQSAQPSEMYQSLLGRFSATHENPSLDFYRAMARFAPSSMLSISRRHLNLVKRCVVGGRFVFHGPKRKMLLLSCGCREGM